MEQTTLASLTFDARKKRARCQIANYLGCLLSKLSEAVGLALTSMPCISSQEQIKLYLQAILRLSNKETIQLQGVHNKSWSQIEHAAAKGFIGNLMGSGSDNRGSTTRSAIAGISRDASLDNQALARPDMNKRQENAEFEQALNNFGYQVGTYFTDEAYRTMFIKAANVYEVQRDENGKLLRDEDGRPIFGKPLTDEEKMHLKPSADGIIYIANNGIFNDEKAAENYAYQHSGSGDGPQYFIDFPEASSSLSELLVAGYQKNPENDFLCLANATQEAKSMMLLYGQDGLHLDGHSRGSMTIGNALESIARMSGSGGILSNTTITCFGPAYNTSSADKILSSLQRYSGASDSTRPDDMVLLFQNNIGDPVGRLIGGSAIQLAFGCVMIYKRNINIFYGKWKKCTDNLLEKNNIYYGRATYLDWALGYNHFSQIHTNMKDGRGWVIAS